MIVLAIAVMVIATTHIQYREGFKYQSVIQYCYGKACNQQPKWQSER